MVVHGRSHAPAKVETGAALVCYIFDAVYVQLLFVCLFIFLALQPTVVYFHSPVAGFSLLVFKVS
jgi:hypothetical protein